MRRVTGLVDVRSRKSYFPEILRDPLVGAMEANTQTRWEDGHAEFGGRLLLPLLYLKFRVRSLASKLRNKVGKTKSSIHV